MQNVISKTIGIFMLAVLVMSVTGAAATTCSPCKAKVDTFDLSSSKNHGNVLANDIGKDIKVVGTSSTANGGKVTMYSKGDFYYKPASFSKNSIHDSFTYTIANKCGQKSTAKVVINYKYASKNSTGTSGTSDTPTNDTGFETVYPHDGNTYWVGADGHKISLLHNKSAINPTYSQLLSFIKNDQTDQRKYVPGQYTCGDFAETVQNNAEKAGYKAGWVAIEGINHCCNAFQTTDKGMIYIDCTGSPNGGGSWDTSVKLAKGKEYLRIPLFIDNIYFNSMGTVNSFEEYW
jgi:Bacterial Ig domain